MTRGPVDLAGIRARHASDGLPMSALDPRHMGRQAHEDRGHLLAVADALAVLLRTRGDHMTACDRTMGDTHPCTCGADVADLLLGPTNFETTELPTSLRGDFHD